MLMHDHGSLTIKSAIGDRSAHAPTGRAVHAPLGGGVHARPQGGVACDPAAHVACDVGHNISFYKPCTPADCRACTVRQAACGLAHQTSQAGLPAG
jgi:hypothetical protein